MTETAAQENFPNHFQRESLELVNRLLPLSSSGFYLVGPDMQHRGVVMRDIPLTADRDYRDNYSQLDPLNPAAFVDTEVKVAVLDEQLSEQELLGSRYYQEFMRPLGHRHVADMFLRHEQDIIAVLTMLRNSRQGHFTAGELLMLRSLQPFLEYTLNRLYLPRRYRQRQSAQTRYGLTDRELDVVEFMIGGAGNRAIAEGLGLSLATVKTHIQHIFQKTGVPSRAVLSAKLLGDPRD